MKNILQEMRPRQWTKNFFVYAALLFHGSLFDAEKFWAVTEIFAAFCLLSSGVYFFNDIFDYAADRINPDKKNRPIAAGKISIPLGYFCAAVFSTVALIVAYRLNAECFALLFSYAAVNFLYTTRLKHVIILDVLAIAYGFVVRALAGAAAAAIFLTEWFLLCVMFLSIFLALGKRRHELISGKSARKVLQSYSVELLDQLTTIIAAALIICYALFAVNAGRAMALTVPLVLYGIFYYLYVVRVKGKGGAPEILLYAEPPILLTVMLYVAAIIFIRNF